MCVTETERERETQKESVTACVCVRERLRKREREARESVVSIYQTTQGMERGSRRVSMCDCEMERESVVSSHGERRVSVCV